MVGLRRFRPAISVGLLLALASAVPSPARAQRAAGALGIGVILFDPAGFSAKYWADRNTAYDLALGARGGDFAMNADLLLHLDTVLSKGAPAVPFYVGLGAQLASHDSAALGVRFVGGVSYFVKQHPLELFAELVPVMRVAPRFGSDLDVAVGLRYYLGRRARR